MRRFQRGFNRQPLELRRTSIETERTLDDNDDIVNTFYLHMFYEDVRLQLFPYSSRHGAGVTITSGERYVRDAIIEGFSFGTDSYAHDLTDTIFEWCRDAALRLLRNGEVVYEVARLWKERSLFPDGFAVVLVNERTVREERGQLIQRVGRRRRRLRRAIRATLPFQYLASMKALGRLTRLSSMRATQILVSQMTAPGSAFNYDEYKAFETGAVAEATSAFGWNARQPGQFHAYHMMYRQLRFARLLAALRATTLQLVKDAVHIGGALTGFETDLDFRGLLTDTDLDALERGLLQGSVAFSELIRRTG